jgi:hypothetical protein
LADDRTPSDALPGRCGYKFAFRLVVGQHAANLFSRLFHRESGRRYEFLNPGNFHAIAKGGDFAIDADAASFDFGFDFTAGAVASAGQHFLISRY